MKQTKLSKENTIVDGVNLEKQEFEFNSKRFSFLKVKDVTQVSHTDCRLWAIEWKSAFAFSEFIFLNESMDGLSVLEIGLPSSFLIFSLSLSLFSFFLLLLLFVCFLP
jgi:hypothetical protein